MEHVNSKGIRSNMPAPFVGVQFVHVVSVYASFIMHDMRHGNENQKNMYNQRLYYWLLRWKFLSKLFACCGAWTLCENIQCNEVLDVFVVVVVPKWIQL